MRHRDEIEASDSGGCFYCLAIFGPTEIDTWTEHPNPPGITALCPRCGIDSVIGSASGLPIAAEFLGQMNRRWFSAR